MKICGLIVVLAFISCAKANCGCLKCSKHLTVAGQSIPVGPCGPAKIIFRGPPGTRGDTLPVSVQVPSAFGPGGATGGRAIAPGDLNCRNLVGGAIVGGGPYIGGGYIGGGTVVGGGTIIGTVAYPRVYDSRIEAPVPLPKPIGGSINIPLPIPPERLTACVDRVVIPSPPIDYGQAEYNNVYSGSPSGSVVISGGVRSVITPGVGVVGPYVGPIGPRRVSCSGSSLGPGPVVFPGSGSIVSGGTIVSTGTIGSVGTISTVGTVTGPGGVLVNPYRDGLSYTCGKGPLLPSGPALDSLQRERISRYIPIPNIAFINMENTGVKHADIDITKNLAQCSDQKVGVRSRSKRELPFIKHGYKFVMNMLPDFLQQPIKNTVNTFALTHPDRNLQNIYNQPRELTLKEKIQLQSRRNLEALKQKLLGHKNKLVTPGYVNDYLPGRSSGFLFEEPLKRPFSKPSTLYSRFSEADENLNDDRNDIDISTDRIMEILRRTMDTEDFQIQSRFSSRNPNQKEFPHRDRASKTIESGYMNGYPQEIDEECGPIRNQNKYIDAKSDKSTEASIEDESSESDRISQMADLQKIIFLKKLKKLDEVHRRNKRSTYFQKKRRLSQSPKSSSVLLDSDQMSLPFYQIKNGINAEDSRGKYYSDNDRSDLKDEILRAVIRKELKKFKTERQSEMQGDPFSYSNMAPHSPLFHLINFPLMLIKTFTELGGQSFPTVASLPKMITGTNKYFRNFGKNLKRNMFHLFSDVVGEFDKLPSSNNLPDNIFTPRRHRRNLDQIRENTNDFGVKTSEQKSHKRKHEHYEPDYSLAFGRTIKDIKRKKKVLHEKKLEEINFGRPKDTINNEQILYKKKQKQVKLHDQIALDGLNEDLEKKAKVPYEKKGEDFRINYSTTFDANQDQKKKKKVPCEGKKEKQIKYYSPASEAKGDPKTKLPRKRRQEQYEPDYSLVFVALNDDQNFHNSFQAKVRNKRYLLKMVDEEEVEDFLMEKLGGLFGYQDETVRMSNTGPQTFVDQNCPFCHMHSTVFETPEDEDGEKIVIEQLKPKLIIDNNGLPFLEINGYKKPMLSGSRGSRLRSPKRKNYGSVEDYKYSSEEVSIDKISYLIDHAKDHLEDRLMQRNVEMPIKTIKEKISRQLFDTDMMVHMEFDKYHDIFDDLFKIQHIKTSAVQDWKRLLMSKRVNDIGGKISILGKFQEMQRYKDDVLKKIALALNEDCDNKFATKNLVKMLVRLQKLQCLINEVVGNFQGKLQMQSKFDSEKEIRYVDILGSINFVNAKTRNDMVDNLKKSRDVALQQNILLLDKFKKLLTYEHDHDKISEQASLLWEMGNIEKMQMCTIEEMNQRLNDGLTVKKELKILFDLLKRQGACEEEQTKLLSKFDEGSGEEECSEECDRLGAKRILAKKKFDVNEFRAKWQERLKQRKMLLRKNLRKTLRNRTVKDATSECDEDD